MRWIVAMVAVVVAVVAALRWSGSAAPSAGVWAKDASAGSDAAGPIAAARHDRDPAGDGAAVEPGTDRRRDEVPTTAHADLDAGAARSAEGWPVAPTSASRPAARATAGAAPAVATDLAFQALRLVGVDAQAEGTWRRAIDDPAMPPGVRSDLIEDLNQEGYTDDSHPAAADLPLILARMELIERLAPHAIDEVNAAAFAEAYKDLLAMYVRLGGAPRTGR